MSSDNPDRVMLDIETLGTEPGAALLSVAAVEFRPTAFDGDDAILDTVHQSVSITSCQDVGLHIDAETLEWWMGQGYARRQLTGGLNVDAVLANLAAFIDERGDDCEIWANSPAFDCQMLAHAYDVVGSDNLPWDYWQTRDVRTLKALPQWPDDLEREGVEHDALDDAKYQARATARTLAQIQEVSDDAE